MKMRRHPTQPRTSKSMVPMARSRVVASFVPIAARMTDSCFRSCSYANSRLKSGIGAPHARGTSLLAALHESFAWNRLRRRSDRQAHCQAGQIILEQTIRRWKPAAWREMASSTWPGGS